MTTAISIRVKPDRGKNFKNGDFEIFMVFITFYFYEAIKNKILLSSKNHCILYENRRNVNENRQKGAKEKTTYFVGGQR